ncbi:MAG: hypothetical protein PHS48_01145 [Bacteroidales bacterium]|nr:hypothetical protein [Bacteroidales bacterium]
MKRTLIFLCKKLDFFVWCAIWSVLNAVYFYFRGSELLARRALIFGALFLGFCVIKNLTGIGSGSVSPHSEEEKSFLAILWESIHRQIDRAIWFAPWILVSGIYLFMEGSEEPAMGIMIGGSIIILIYIVIHLILMLEKKKERRRRSDGIQ